MHCMWGWSEQMTTTAVKLIDSRRNLSFLFYSWFLQSSSFVRDWLTLFDFFYKSKKKQPKLRVIIRDRKKSDFWRHKKLFLGDPKMQNKWWKCKKVFFFQWFFQGVRCLFFAQTAAAKRSEAAKCVPLAVNGLSSLGSCNIVLLSLLQLQLR